MSQHNPYAVSHELRVIRATITLPSSAEEGPTTAHVIGETPTKRAPLWSETNAWGPPLDDRYLEVGDWVHHVVLASLQDRPNTGERLLFSLTGGLGVQDPLF